MLPWELTAGLPEIEPTKKLRSPNLKLKLSGMEGLTPAGPKSAVRSRRSLRRGSSRSARGKQPRNGAQRFKGVSTSNEIELRLLEIPQEAIASHEAKALHGLRCHSAQFLNSRLHI